MPVDLFKICYTLVDEYDPNLSPATYLENFAVTKSFTDYDINFITEVFYGCCDKRSVLDVVIDGFYSKDGKNSLRSDRCVYTGKTGHFIKAKTLNEFTRFFLKSHHIYCALSSQSLRYQRAQSTGHLSEQRKDI